MIENQPDDTRIVVQRTDESPVGIVTRAAIGATGTKVFDQRYPVAGSDNAIVELFVMDPDGGNRIKIDLGPDNVAKLQEMGKTVWTYDCQNNGETFHPIAYYRLLPWQSWRSRHWPSR